SGGDSGGDASGNDSGGDGGDSAGATFTLKVLDDVGAAVEGVDLVFKQEGQVEVTSDGCWPTDSDGSVSWNAPGAGPVTANFADVDALKAKMADAWKTPRDAQIPQGATVVAIGDDPIPDFAVSDDGSTTIYLVPSGTLVIHLHLSVDAARACGDVFVLAADDGSSSVTKTVDSDMTDADPQDGLVELHYTDLDRSKTY